jgi:hypothetical protein
MADRAGRRARSYGGVCVGEDDWLDHEFPSLSGKGSASQRWPMPPHGEMQIAIKCLSSRRKFPTLRRLRNRSTARPIHLVGFVKNLPLLGGFSRYA